MENAVDKTMRTTARTQLTKLAKFANDPLKQDSNIEDVAVILEKLKLSNERFNEISHRYFKEVPMEQCEEECLRMLEYDDNAVTAIIKLQRKLGMLQLKQGERRSLEHMKNNSLISVLPDEKMEPGCVGSSSSVKYCNENDVNAHITTKRQAKWVSHTASVLITDFSFAGSSVDLTISTSHLVHLNSMWLTRPKYFCIFLMGYNIPSMHTLE
ncbi:hypothetical protein FQR65_LT02218 [Abscondita terminalis]|nr:hypothetical protein FQR65_LT02218 [Abscondita terminalis]